MRVLGHPVHVMLVHFPVALWPAHACLHFFSSRLPPGAVASTGFWLLGAGTLLGWLAAVAGLSDLIARARQPDPVRLRHGLVHAAINGAALLGFTVLTALEYARFPFIVHGAGFLAAEAGLLGAMAVGNYFGGAVIWSEPARKGPGS